MNYAQNMNFYSHFYQNNRLQKVDAFFSDN